MWTREAEREGDVAMPIPTAMDAWVTVRVMSMGSTASKDAASEIWSVGQKVSG